MGIVALFRPLADMVRHLQERLAGTLPFARLHAERLARVVVIAALAVLFLANPAWLRTVTLLADVPLPGEERPPNWPAVRPALEPLLKRVPVVVTTEELGTQYYLGRFDIRFSPSKLHEFSDGSTDFLLDPRTGRPVIAQVASLERVIDCYPEGLFVLNSSQWNRPHLFSPEVRELLLARTESVALPPRTRVTALTWKHAPGTVPPAGCADLPPLPGPAARIAPHG
jgi:hypothetical protein